jgi:phosphoserine phosphatase
LGEFVKANGLAAEYKRFFYSRVPKVLLARAGFINAQRFRESWFADMTRFLRGFRRDKIDTLMQQVIDASWTARRVAVIAELERYIAQGVRVIIASGTYQQAAEGFATRIGAEAIGTGLDIDADGMATGQLLGNVSTGETKLARVRERLNGGALIAAYGDTEGDIPLLSAAQQGVAVDPDKKLHAVAVAKGWRVIQ